MFEDVNYSQAQHAEVYQRYKSGANWFYWIAGLSLITSIVSFAGGGWRFLISLGITQVIDGLGELMSAELGGAPKVVALVLDIVVTGLFVLFGVLAGKKLLWAYMVGMILFGLDGLVSLLGQDLIGVLAHAVVLFFMARGYMAGRELMALEREMVQVPPPAPAI
jgi:hypothetical protein